MTLWGRGTRQLDPPHNERPLRMKQEAPLSFSTDRAGFTLLELLVAMAIFSMLMSLVSVTFISSTGMIKRLDLPYAEESRALSRLRDSVGSLFAYIGQRQSVLFHDDALYPVFSGSSAEMTFVSMQPLQGKGPALCHLWLEQGQLLFEQSPIYQARCDFLDPHITDRQPLRSVLAKDVDQLKLSYYSNGEFVSDLREVNPTLVKMIFSRGQVQRELYFRVGAGFAGKKVRTMLYMGSGG